MRLTKEDIEQSIFNKHFIGARIVGKQMFATMCQELLEYKDIEKDLGIDLITLFKALKNGIWVRRKYTNEIEFARFSHLGWEDIIEPDIPYLDVVEIKDFGKAWALTKEELER